MTFLQFFFRGKTTFAERVLAKISRLYNWFQRGIAFFRRPHLKSCGSAILLYFVTKFGGLMQNTSERNCANFQVDPLSLSLFFF